MPTKADILRKIPMFRRGDVLHPRPAFRDVHRMLSSYTYGENELTLLDGLVDVLMLEFVYGETKYRKDE